MSLRGITYVTFPRLLPNTIGRNRGRESRSNKQYSVNKAFLESQEGSAAASVSREVHAFLHQLSVPKI